MGHVVLLRPDSVRQRQGAEHTSLVPQGWRHKAISPERYASKKATACAMVSAGVVVANCVRTRMSSGPVPMA
jgi:hypothetical protein